MSKAAGEQPAGASLTPEEWEARLVEHYLRSDGPFGGTELSWLDATPAELAIASGIEGLSDSEAQAAFLRQFRRSSVTDCLDGRYPPPSLGSRGPGYFRFLVLTCLVSATDQGAGRTHDFRIRLGALLDGEGPLQSVRQVNDLWLRLAAWCDSRRALGEPIRRVLLPGKIGRMKLIGYAVRIAFPSWRDRSALTPILRVLPDRVRRSPVRLVEELARPQHWHALSPALRDAYHDFSARLRRAPGLLGGHRFWRLIESIDERLQAEGGGAAGARWRLELSFGGWEQDLVEGRLFRGRHRDREAAAEWEGPFAELLRLDPARLPAALARSLKHGGLIMGEAPGAIWTVDDLGLAGEGTVVVLARAGSVVRKWPLETHWRDVGGEWACTERLNASAVAGLLRSLGLGGREGERLLELGFENGVPTRRGAWLGRPAFLPEVRTSPGSVISVRALPPTTDAVTAGQEGTVRPLVAAGQVTGRWRVFARESGAEDDRLLVLEAEIPERREWTTEAAAWESETEIVVTGERPLPPAAGRWAELDPAEPTAFDDLAEALYASVGSARGESELVELMARVLPRRWMAWDVLRGFAEAGWMTPRVYRSWRARRWRLCPPTLVRVSSGALLVEGAVGTAARRRLADAARRRGGSLNVRGSDWSPPVLVVHEVDAAPFAGEMEWPLTRATRPELQPAPACWPPEKRSTDGRELVGLWNFEAGLFAPPEGSVRPPVRLERWAQESDRDLYRSVCGEEVFLTTSRTAAVLEAHRRARRPLFCRGDEGLRRSARSGHLPVDVARALRRSSLTPGGPHLNDVGEWTYRYPAGPEEIRWLASRFGAAVEGAETRVPASRMDALVARRRAGLAPTWWTPSRSAREHGA